MRSKRTTRQKSTASAVANPTLGARPKPGPGFDDDDIPDATDPSAWGPAPVDDSWIPTAMMQTPARLPLHMRCDAQALEWFRSQGRGYQNHINAVLVQYYRHHAGRRLG